MRNNAKTIKRVGVGLSKALQDISMLSLNLKYKVCH